MARELVLQLADGTTDYEFDIEGEWTHDQRREHKEAANPPELTRVVEVWEVTDARIVGTSVADTWDNLATFLAIVNDRTTSPLTSAKIVRDPDGTPVIEKTLGPSTYQQFQLELIDYGREQIVPGADYRTVIPVSLRILAVRVFPDGNGIVEWRQTLVNSWENGLQRVELRTELSTAEATDARTKAKTYAKIDIDSYGTTFVWDTNGPDGIEFESDGADETNSRTPTRCNAVSRITQKGITVGSNSPGNSINDPITFSTETVIDGSTRRETTRASASGPGALAWVQGKRPTGDLSMSREFEDTANRVAEGEWVKLTPAFSNSGDSGSGNNADAVNVRRKIVMTLTGGHQDKAFRPMSGNYAPRKVVGPFRPYRLEVQITMELIAEKPTRADMPFPTKLEDPWVLLENQSREDPFPRLVDVGADKGANRWERGAIVVYESGDEPSTTTLQPLVNGEGQVESYSLA